MAGGTTCESMDGFRGVAALSEECLESDDAPDCTDNLLVGERSAGALAIPKAESAEASCCDEEAIRFDCGEAPLLRRLEPDKDLLSETELDEGALAALD